MNILDESIICAYESCKNRFSEKMTLEEFKKLVIEWDIFPVIVDDMVVGAILTNGPEIHACIKPIGFGRWLLKKELLILNSIIDKYGFAITKVKKGNSIGRSFVERLGFFLDSMHEDIEIYKRYKSGN